MSDAVPALLDAEQRPVIEDHVEATTDAAPSPATTTTNDVHVHVPYQIDLMTPRQSISLSANGTPAVKAAAKARNGSSTSSPTPKVQGRPSQAPQLAARVARGKDASHRRRSISAGPLHRPQRRVPSNTPPTAEAAKTEDERNATAAAANVLPTSTRRLGPSGEVIKAPATAATTTTTVTRTTNNNILVRRPRFVDPMAGKSTTVAAPSVTAAAATVEPAPAAQHAPPVPRRTARPVAPIATGPATGNTTTAAASHAALYTHSIPYHNPTRTPQRVPVAADAAATAADAHHRRRLLTSAHATGLVSRAPAASLESTATSTEAKAAAAAAAVTTSSSDAPPQHAATDTHSNQPTSPAASEKSSTPPVSTRTESEAAVDVHETNTDEEPPTRVSEEKQTVADAAAPASTTATGAKPAAHSAHPVKVLPATVAAHGEKRVILSRPTSNPYTMRMSELKRPSESYKVSLNPSLQGSALARRSRQPRKVLNVFLTKYPVIRKLADELGWSMETSEEELNEYKFNLCWSDTVLSLMRLVRLSNWQRTNHFPSMYLLCRKGHLGTTLGKLRHRLPSHFAFYPRTWSMRSERVQFTQYMAAVRQRRILKYFIMKPNSGCQGRGIIVARDPLTALDEHALDNYIVQEYVHRPLLLEGKKFDLRVYVLLTSIRNPSVFLFNDGLVRICTEAYEAPTEENVKNPCKHLTNYAVNKKSADYVFNTDVAHMDVGNKRNFAFLNRWLEESGYSSAELWRQVGIIIVKTILAAQPSIARVYDSCFPTGFNDGYCCFEVLGFDILIDQKMRPWLMEVNHTPSFATETPLDKEIKSKLLTEVWSIIDCKPTDYEKDRQREREEFTKRNMPPWSSNHPVYGSQLRQGNTKQEAATTTTAAADDAETAANGGTSSPAGSQGDVAADVPPYVHARRAHEDSKLQNFTRIYPSEEPEVQLVYDTIQNLALAESANNRLYYNSTVAVPITPPLPTSSPTSTSTGAAAFGMQSNNPLPLRLRPPSLGPVLTTTRVHSSNPSSSSSPNTTMPQRNLATSPSSAAAAAAAAAAASASVQTPTATMAPPNGAPSTIPVSSVPSLAVIRDGHATTSTTPSGVSATSPHASSSVNSRGEPSSKTRLQRAGASSVHSTSRGSAVPSEAAAVPAPPLSSLSLATTTPTTSAGTTPKTADATSAQAARAFTPRASATPATTSRTTTAASTPSAAVAKSSSSTTAATSVTAVKPRVAEVHRRASSRPSTTASNAAVMTELAAAEPVSGNAAVSADEHKTATAPTTTAKSLSPAQSKATPPTADGPAIRIARPSGSRQKSPSLEGPATRGGSHVMEHHHQHQQQQQHSRSASTVKRPSLSMSGSGRDAFDVPSAVHPRQKSVDHEGRSMSTHPEPTDEEIARLVALQAQLDYEAAADPKPDDEDDDYNLTE